MKPRKERSPWLWLLMIPAQLVILLLSVYGGAALDAAIFAHGGDAQGHGIPIFSVLLPLVAGAVTVAVIIAAVALLIVGLARRSRRRKREGQAPAPAPFSPQQPFPPQQSAPQPYGNQPEPSGRPPQPR